MLSTYNFGNGPEQKYPADLGPSNIPFHYNILPHSNTHGEVVKAQLNRPLSCQSKGIFT